MRTPDGPDGVHGCEGPSNEAECPWDSKHASKVVLDMVPIVPVYRYMCPDCHQNWKADELTGDHLT